MMRRNHQNGNAYGYRGSDSFKKFVAKNVDRKQCRNFDSKSHYRKHFILMCPNLDWFSDYPLTGSVIEFPASNLIKSGEKE